LPRALFALHASPFLGGRVRGAAAPGGALHCSRPPSVLTAHAPAAAPQAAHHFAACSSVLLCVTRPRLLFALSVVACTCASP
jgi:hypothetical protein